MTSARLRHVLAGPVISHGRARVRMTGGDLDVAEIDAGIEHRGDERVAQHVRVGPGYLNNGGLGEPVQAAGGCVPVHLGTRLLSRTGRVQRVISRVPAGMPG